MEFAPCLSAPGDPLPGQTSNTPGAVCSGTSQLSAISAGIQAEDAYGKGAYSIPVFARTGAQYVYLNNWQRVINSDGSGVPNFFTWLDAHSANPTVAGTVRQGFFDTTRSVNPYMAETSHDFYTIRNIYDSLMVENPASSSQLIDWMVTSAQQWPNNALGYTPPNGTLSSFRFTLRSDMYFHDRSRVTSFDVAFSYLSLLSSGSFQGASLSAMSGITILGPSQFDINLNRLGPFFLFSITSPTILPGRYWSNAGNVIWDRDTTICTSMTAPCYPAQYTLTSGTSPTCTLDCANFPGANMAFDPTKITPLFDPIAAHIFVGSGPWQCGVVTASGSGHCATGDVQNPNAGSSYTLTRFGKGLAPASSVSGSYFRSNGNLALCIWASGGGDACNFHSSILFFSEVAGCYGQPVNLSGPCAHWQQGIGNPGSGTVVGISQVAIVLRFYNVNWVAPFDWATNPPIGIGTLPPVLYEGPTTLSPASVVGCPSGYDC